MALIKPLWRVALLLAVAAVTPLAWAQNAGDDTVLQAREALRKKDRLTLAAARQTVNLAQHPLAMWVEYWELANRLTEAQQPELEAFYTRWPGTYVEDRLRNDWLLELGRRRDWVNLRAEFPRFRMNDDREVTCYALLAEHLLGGSDKRSTALTGGDLRSAARAAWLAQREPEDGCALMARSLSEARVLKEEDAWAALRQAIEHNRVRAARAAAAAVNPATVLALEEILENPQRWLQRRPHGNVQRAHELELLALMRMAHADPDFVAGLLEGAWADRLPQPLAATAWAHTAKQAALKHSPQAADHARRAWRLWTASAAPPWSEDLLAWHVRAALRQPASDQRRWALIQRAIEAMPQAEQRDPAWVYWKARATAAQAKPDAEGDGARMAAQGALESIASPVTFYGQLATEDLGRKVVLPTAPLPVSTSEREAARALPGLQRALQLVSLGLRNEGVREWNFSLRGMADRELLAAAQWACEREVWDRCINTSDRSKTEIDVAQRYPMPWRGALLGAARSSGLDAAVLYGLIRQESRFIADARSHVGASGLMQLMPATARWTAKKIGLDFRPEMINDRDVNLQLGAAYLKRVLDDFGGSLALAAAAYNAGPGRPRRWREGVTLEAAAWAESIPFNETRDYVKKVLSNSVTYAALLGAPAPTLKSRLGSAIGPRDPGSAASDRDLP
ncbi:MAG TPA: transglycosylase SLT domain-containing protein [Rubrivivax sp.]|nr:transglycosylase SLT domain-containing protein [Rubrivivax sp.]